MHVSTSLSNTFHLIWAGACVRHCLGRSVAPAFTNLQHSAAPQRQDATLRKHGILTTSDAPPLFSSTTHTYLPLQEAQWFSIDIQAVRYRGPNWGRWLARLKSLGDGLSMTAMIIEARHKCFAKHLQQKSGLTKTTSSCRADFSPLSPRMLKDAKGSA